MPAYNLEKSLDAFNSIQPPKNPKHRNRKPKYAPKATGTVKAIHGGSKYVGVKKALVFYNGRPPKGVKTNWIMHEYRLSNSHKQIKKHNGSMRLDDWVLYRIYKKKNSAEKNLDHKVEESNTQIDRVGSSSDKTTCVETDGDGDGDVAEGLVEGNAPGGPVGVFGGKWVGNLGMKI
ncbi:hypothetical protein J1N35_041172 [Gossypium stocksii]|uniref:NAC domain-containing protein n=1 Tax=Gossypium stocksii TaxID=47602 RepID=A0A9D3UFH9_9ROSI|nr:hypothetical protein J1N35_041172 [Gossypium stocksii]